MIILQLDAEQLCSLFKSSFKEAFNELPQPETGSGLKKLLTVSEASKLLNLEVSTIYSKTCKFEIPFYKNGKMLQFDEEELLIWQKQGRRKTRDEINKEANNFISGKKNGGRSC